MNGISKDFILAYKDKKIQGKINRECFFNFACYYARFESLGQYINDYLMGTRVDIAFKKVAKTFDLQKYNEYFHAMMGLATEVATELLVEDKDEIVEVLLAMPKE